MTVLLAKKNSPRRIKFEIAKINAMIIMKICAADKIFECLKEIDNSLENSRELWFYRQSWLQMSKRR